MQGQLVLAVAPTKPPDLLAKIFEIDVLACPVYVDPATALDRSPRRPGLPAPDLREHVMKRLLTRTVAAIVGAFAFGVLGLMVFGAFGGNRCDQPPALTCDCFCCHLFGSRGYESCGLFGAALGAIVGVTAGVLVVPRSARGFP